MSKYSEDFNWKAAEADVEDRGGDLDMLYTRNGKNRDSYLRELDLDPKRYAKKSSGSSSGGSEDGCYVATCVYGDYDCPEVWTLRRFRDQHLGASAAGRSFIRTYYKISPKLVSRFGDSKWFRRFWKGILDRMVVSLQRDGYECTPYQDQNWRK